MELDIVPMPLLVINLAFSGMVNGKNIHNELSERCPDCGCNITTQNDGGNGFCINCASNH